MPSYKQQKPQDEPKPWPAGTYTVEIIDAQEKVSNSDNEMIVLKCKVVEKDQTTGAGINDYLVFSPKAIWKIDQVRAALGETIVPDEEIEINADDFVGRRGKVVLKIKADDDRWNEIERWVAAEPAPKADTDAIPF
jgi:RNase P/RNase MRP subunit p29